MNGKNINLKIGNTLKIMHRKEEEIKETKIIYISKYFVVVEIKANCAFFNNEFYKESFLTYDIKYNANPEYKFIL